MKRIGMLTPSSNTILEPETFAMLSALPDVSVHFGRFSVTEITLSDKGVGQFDIEPMLTAARLLAEAKVDGIIWNGTSAGWLGEDSDAQLCASISQETGIPCSSVVLGQRELFRRLGVHAINLVDPYTEDVNAAIQRTFGAMGTTVAGWSSFNEHVNWNFSQFTRSQIKAKVQELMQQHPDADGIYAFCTNMKAADLAIWAEGRYGIPFIDSTALAVWEALRVIEYPNADRLAQQWGTMFNA